MSWKHVRGRRVVLHAVIGLLLVGVSLATVVPPAEAAPTRVLQIAVAAKKEVAQRGETFRSIEFVAEESSAHELFLSGSADGTTPTAVDDALSVEVRHSDGTSSSLDHDFSSGCAGWIRPEKLDLSKVLKSGRNVVRVELKDACGGNAGNDEMWVVGKGNYTLAGSPTGSVPSPVPTPTCPDPSAVLNANLLPVYPEGISGRQGIRMSYGNLKLRFSSIATGAGATCTLRSNRGAMPIVLHFYKRLRYMPVEVNVGNQTVAQSVTTATLDFIPANRVSAPKCDFALIKSSNKLVTFDPLKAPDTAKSCVLNNVSNDPRGYYVKWSIPGFEEFVPSEKFGRRVTKTAPMEYYVDLSTLTRGARIPAIDSALVDSAENYIHKTLIANLPQVAPMAAIQPLLGN